MYFSLLRGSLDRRCTRNRNRLSFFSGLVHIDETIAIRAHSGMTPKPIPLFPHGLYRFWYPVQILLLASIRLPATRMESLMETLPEKSSAIANLGVWYQIVVEFYMITYHTRRYCETETTRISLCG